ncbi:MAG: hypothetical protein IPH31_26575 [Lewinellaceae bacterium]|nr:hypothetical protein [Lewinellaceae bacterium]
MALQAAVSLTGFYLAEFSMPPRFLLIIGPPFLVILALFNHAGGKRFLDQMDLSTLMWLHTIRVPLEIGFFWLNQYGYFPTEMTYDGQNFGYLAGLTAPIPNLVYNANRHSKTTLGAFDLECFMHRLNAQQHPNGNPFKPSFCRRTWLCDSQYSLGIFPIYMAAKFSGSTLFLCLFSGDQAVVGKKGGGYLI